MGEGSEWACQEEPRGEGNLVLSFSCPVLSGDGWAEVHGRAGLWGAGDWPCWDFTGAGAGDPGGVMGVLGCGQGGESPEGLE